VRTGKSPVLTLFLCEGVEKGRRHSADPNIRPANNNLVNEIASITASDGDPRAEEATLQRALNRLNILGAEEAPWDDLYRLVIRQFPGDHVAFFSEFPNAMPDRFEVNHSFFDGLHLPSENPRAHARLLSTSLPLHARLGTPQGAAGDDHAPGLGLVRKPF
jgi:hypothetical protein